MEDPLEEAQGRAILAAKATNISQMEDALAAEIPINTADPYGNSLLILAAQQGSQVKTSLLVHTYRAVHLSIPILFLVANVQVLVAKRCKYQPAESHGQYSAALLLCQRQ